MRALILLRSILGDAELEGEGNTNLDAGSSSAAAVGTLAKPSGGGGERTPSRYHRIAASLASCRSVGRAIFEYPLFSEYHHFSLQSGPPVEAVISTLTLKQPKTLTPTLTLTQTLHLSYFRFFKCQMREFVSPLFLM